MTERLSDSKAAAEVVYSAYAPDSAVAWPLLEDGAAAASGSSMRTTRRSARSRFVAA